MIGILDSGIGGVVTLSRILETSKFKNTSFLCLADQANTPYGEKTKEELLEITCRNLKWFKEQGVNTVLIACNTICSSIFDEVNGIFEDMNLINIVNLTCEYLASRKIDSIIILATKLSIESKTYQSQLHHSFPKASIYPVIASALVPLIEDDKTDEEKKGALQEYLAPYLGKAESILLGCTHYPLLKDLIYEIIPVEIYDSNEAIIADLVAENDEQVVRVFTSGCRKKAVQQVEKILGFKIDVEQK